MRRAAARADGIIAISRFTGCVWGNVVTDVPITVVPNGFGTDPPPLDRPSCPWGAEHVKVLLVGDMVPWKRHALFLEALRTAHLSMPELRGVIVGRAHDKSAQRYLKELRGYARALDLHHLVQFVTDADDAALWIAASDVLLSVADREPFGRTVVEGLRLGKPVVATRGGGPEEILSDCSAGTLVAPSAQGIADGIRHWRDGGARVGSDGAARERAAREHSSLNASFRGWLRRYAGREEASNTYQTLMDRFGYACAGRHFNREELNER